MAPARRWATPDFPPCTQEIKSSLMLNLVSSCYTEKNMYANTSNLCQISLAKSKSDSILVLGLIFMYYWRSRSNGGSRFWVENPNFSHSSTGWAMNYREYYPGHNYVLELGFSRRNIAVDIVLEVILYRNVSLI